MKQKLYAMFIDLQKAYDTIPRDRLWSVLLEELNLEPALVKALKLMYVGLKADIRGGGCQELISILLGLKQGCPCSPQLFGFYFDRLKARIE